MRNFILRRFQANTLSEPTQSLIITFLSYSSAVRSISILSDTFLILYVLDAVGYAAAGLLVAIRLLVQGFFDYPTGILSDVIGQKLVLTLSYVFYAVSYFLFSTATLYGQFIFAYIFFAIGFAQQSGTLQTWFDNHYRSLTLQEDPERKVYKIFIGKARTVIDLFGALFLLLGGYLATRISREFVFQIQIAGMAILIILTWIMIDNHSSTLENEERSYFGLLKEGVTSVIGSKSLTLMVIAAVIFQAGLSIWGDLIIFPIYFGYTGTDFGASSFRFTLFILGSVALWLVADRIGGTLPYKWLPRVHLFHTVFFYGGLYLLFLFFPISNSFNMGGLIMSGLIIFISHMLRVGIYIWIQQIYLDLIPDHRRNGFYSFVPTIVIFAQAPFTIGSGNLIESEGYLLLTIILGIVTLFSSFLYYLAMRSLQRTNFKD